MARSGYLGGRIIPPGGAPPSRVGALGVSHIARLTGLGSHVANVKRQNIVMDAAAIVAREHNFVMSNTKVGLSPARLQNFGATGGQHAAHAMKRFTFDNRDIIEVYTRKGIDEIAVLGLETMLGLVTDVDRRANLSIDKRLENNPKRLAQLQLVVDSSIGNLPEARKLARELEFQRRFFDSAMLRLMHGGFDGDANYAQMLSEYEATLSASPPADEAPELMVDMVARLIDP
jgi:hypothetical protein